MISNFILALAVFLGLHSAPAPQHIIHYTLPVAPCEVAHRPYRISGDLKIDDHSFRFVSGGKGWSIPYGNYEITPDDVGRWGRRHGALGLNHDDGIPDPQLHRDRQGIEIHAWPGSTAGCIGIPRGFKTLKRLTLAMIKKNGHAFLHVWPRRVEITPDQS